MLPKRILISGATGLIGRQICKYFLEQECQVSVLTRDPFKAQHILGSKVTYLNSLSHLTSLDSFDAVINLAGEPIAGKRWTHSQKQKLAESRFNITEKISQLIQASQQPPSVFISGSAVGFYGNKGDEILTEQALANDGLTHRLCSRWEELALMAQSERTRVCLLRTSIVLAPKGGALSKLLPLFKLGLGGRLGSGKQYMSWIHLDDMVAAILFILVHKELSGAINMAAPNPVTNQEFTHTLGQVLNRPTLFFVPQKLLELGLGEMAQVLLDSQRAVPEKLMLAGFGFSYPDLHSALMNVIN